MKLFGILIFSTILHITILLIPIKSKIENQPSINFKKGKIVTTVTLSTVTKKKIQKKVTKKKATSKKTPIKDMLNEKTTKQEIVGVEVKSVLDFKPKPKYPKISRMRGETGKVSLAVKIDEFGKVESAKIITSSGSKRLDNAAKKASLKASFSPAIKNGVQVASDHIIHYDFVLE